MSDEEFVETLTKALVLCRDLAVKYALLHKEDFLKFVEEKCNEMRCLDD